MISDEDISVIKDFLIENLGEPEYLNPSILVWKKDKFGLSLVQSWSSLYINVFLAKSSTTFTKIELSEFPSPNWFNVFIQQLKAICENLA